MDLSAERLSEMIGLIYDSALGPAGWPDCLARIAEGLGFEQAAISLQDLPSGRILLNETSGMAPEWRDMIPSYAADIVALWGGPARIAAHPVDEPAVLSRINPEIADGSSRNRYYLEWRKPQGLIDTLAVSLLRDGRSVASASLVRHERQGAISDLDVERMRLFAPHLRRAVLISRLLDMQTLREETATGLLDALAAPVLLADRDLRLVYANAAAEAALARGEPLVRAGGRVQAAAPRVHDALRRAAAELSAPGGAPARDIAAPTQAGEATMLHLLGLHRRRGAYEVAGVLIAVSHSAPNPGPPLDRLGLALGLTPTQAAVFRLIAEGRSVAEAARALDVAVSTVRSHLLQIYDKCGLRGQADLMRLASALRGPLRTP